MHLIRLHGPWTAELARHGALSTERVHLPRDWPTVMAAARMESVALLRRFHRPTGLTSSSRVWLAIPQGWPIARLTINGEEPTRSSDDRTTRFDITEIIRSQEAHELRIEFEVGDRLQGTAYAVGIEIEDGAE